MRERLALAYERDTSLLGRGEYRPVGLKKYYEAELAIVKRGVASGESTAWSRRREQNTIVQACGRSTRCRGSASVP